MIDKWKGENDMPRIKKDGTPVEIKARKPRTTDPDARIALVDVQIQRLEKLNESRRELISQTEKKLNERKEALNKSEIALQNAREKRERIVAFKERGAMTKEERAARRASEKAKITELLEAMKATGISLDDLISKLTVRESTTTDENV